MLRPESWNGLAGESPVVVGIGVAGGGPRFVVQTCRAERRPRPAVAAEEPLAVSPVKVRQLQRALWAAAKIVLESVFEADFLPCLYRGWPERLATVAMERSRTGFVDSYQFVVDFDIANFFGEIDHKRLPELVGSRVGLDIRDVIVALAPILCGWVNYFRIGNAATKFIEIDRYVVWRLFRLMVKKRVRNLRAGQADHWTQEWFDGRGLHQLRGTIRYPKAA